MVEVTRGSSPRVWGQVLQYKFPMTEYGIIPTRVGTSLSGSEYRPILRDHPHACGDKIISATVRRNSVGSSPRVWGQVLLYSTNITKTHYHPHACGDKYTVYHLSAPCVGSSPRVWGQGLTPHTLGSVVPIIPTRVGTSSISSSPSSSISDHPHACGDKAAVKLFKLVRDVSSPRVWGQGLSALGFRLFLGIIPTRVGTSYTTGFLICQGGDHPHACGDKQSSD